MKKLIALGDTHGRTIWEKITNKEKADKIVFIGDYFDTHFDVTPEEQILNFNNIISFKRHNPDKVVLLFGNHDYHYLRTTREQYSGFQYGYKDQIATLLHDALDNNLLQMCYAHENFLFSHAGFTRTWCEANNIDLKNIQESANRLFLKKPGAFRFTCGINRDGSGNDICQTPIWVRPESLMKDCIAGYTQVVGHTMRDKIKPEGNIILIDALGSRYGSEYLKIIDGCASAGKINTDTPC